MAARRSSSKSFLDAYRIERDPLLGPKSILGRAGLHPALSARPACHVAIRYSVALRIASAASRLLGFVAGHEAAAGVFSLFLMSGLPSAREILGSGWSRAVVVGNFELFAQVMTGQACAGSRFQRRVRRRRSVRRCPRADAG
jgi:hypothetical protein